MQNVHLKCGYKYSYLLTYLLILSSTRVLDKIQSRPTRAVNSSIRTPLHISRHLEFIIEHGHRVNCVSDGMGQLGAANSATGHFGAASVTET